MERRCAACADTSRMGATHKEKVHDRRRYNGWRALARCLGTGLRRDDGEESTLGQRQHQDGRRTSARSGRRAAKRRSRCVHARYFERGGSGRSAPGEEATASGGCGCRAGASQSRAALERRAAGVKCYAEWQAGDAAGRRVPQLRVCRVARLDGRRTRGRARRCPLLANRQACTG